jgi:hypothetical protein
MAEEPDATITGFDVAAEAEEARTAIAITRAAKTVFILRI